MLAFSTQVRGFKPGRNHRTFKGEKILSTPSFGGEVKPLVPCRRFTACKRTLNGVVVGISRQNYRLSGFKHIRLMTPGSSTCSPISIIISQILKQTPHGNIIQWRPLIIIADNVINRLLLSKPVVPKHSI